MRERVRQLGGRFEMRSTSEGSMVVAVLSVPRETTSSGVSENKIRVLEKTSMRLNQVSEIPQS
jgi:hypothetical protein